MKKIIISCFILINIASGSGVANDDQKEGSATSSRTEVNRILENFRRGMNRYFERTGNPKRISEILTNMPDRKELDQPRESKKRPDVSTSLNPPAIPNSGKSHKASLEMRESPFEKILRNSTAYQQAPSLQISRKIFADLTQLIIAGELQDVQKDEALEIANVINNPNLTEWLKTSEQKAEKSISPVKILPFIINKIWEGESVESIKTLLMQSKRVNLDLLSSRVELELEDQYKSATLVNGRVLSAIVQLFPKIKKLNLRNCKALKNEDLEYLNELFNILTLDLSYTSITDEGLKSLQNLERLTNLFLSYTPITGMGLQNLQNLKYLYFLDLSHTSITDKGLESLQNLKHLNILYLSGTAITDAGLQTLQNVPYLWHLDLSHTPITDKGLPSLKNLTNLTNLVLNNTSITDEGLKSLPNLSYLDLRYTSITDEGLENLKAQKKLTILHLTKSDKITEKGIESLKAALPNLEVYYSLAD